MLQSLMDTTTAQLYDILVEKGFDKTRVREALSEVVSRDEMSTHVDQGFDRVRAELKTEIMSLRSEMYRALLIHGFVTVATVLTAATVL